MSDHFALSHESVVSTGTIVPRREYDLIEFYKKVKQDPRFDKIIGVEFDEEIHTVVFHIILKQKTKLEKESSIAITV